MRTCSAGGCDGPINNKSARGLCRKHYARFLRAADPSTLRRSGTLAERFAQRFTPGGPGQCWEWEGLRDKGGYGMISEGKRNRRG